MQICDQGAINLLAGVIKRAKQDWKRAQRCLRMHPHSKSAMDHAGMIIDCERFFRSAHFARMTGLNGEAFICALKEQEDDHEKP